MGNIAKSISSLLYTAEKLQAMDSLAVKEFGIDGFDLMRRAGAEAFKALCQYWPEWREKKLSLQVFCGGGNNGGDGYIIAGLAKQKGMPVSVIGLKAPDQLQGNAKKAWRFCHDLGVDIVPFISSTAVTGDVLVDAIVGIGLHNEVQGDYRLAIDLMNESCQPILAVDIPSGLCADTGAVLGAAVKACLTVTFIGLKQGLYTAMGPDHCGKQIFSGLDIPIEVYDKHTPSCLKIAAQDFTGLLGKRPRCSHKGSFGDILLIGGNYGMPGAVIMAAEAAMACGAGKVTVVTRSEHVNALAIRCPEVMVLAVNSANDLKKIVQGKTAIIIGPGLGIDSWSRSFLRKVVKAECPLLLDADALNLIAVNPEVLQGRTFPVLVTPHPGEAARMLGVKTKWVQENRFKSVRAVYEQLNAVVVLKGAGTLICSEQTMRLCAAGNPGMAVAGMGDILSGVIGALLGQGIPPAESAFLGVWLHSVAADELVLKQGEVGVLATELIPYIRKRLNNLIAEKSNDQVKSIDAKQK